MIIDIRKSEQYIGGTCLTSLEDSQYDYFIMQVRLTSQPSDCAQSDLDHSQTSHCVKLVHSFIYSVLMLKPHRPYITYTNSSVHPHNNNMYNYPNLCS